MSTVTEPTTTGATQYLDFDQFVDYQLQKTRAGIRTADLLTALVSSALALLGYLFVFVICDHWIVPGGFGDLSRLLMLLGVLAALGTWLTWKVILPARRRVTALYAAKELEHSQPGLKNNLLTLVDLQRSGRPVSPQIISTMQKRAAKTLSETNVEEAVDRRPLLYSTYALCGLMALMFAYVVLSPKKMSASIWRALLPTMDVAAATRTRIERVSPGDATVLRGEQVTVEADLTGDVPQEIQLFYTTADQQYVDEPLAMRTVDDRLNRFRCVLAGERGRGLMQNITYRISAGDAVSQVFTLTVKQPPSAAVEEVSYRFPDYMRLSPRTDAGGTIDAWEGTTATVRARVNMPVASAVIQYGDNERFETKAEEFPMTVRDGTRLEGAVQLRLRPDGTVPQFYRIQVKTADGATDPQPVPHPLRIREDLPPKLVLHNPRGDLQLPANAIVPLAYRARDPDFLLHSVTLFYKRVGDEHARQFPLGRSPLNEQVVEDTFRLPLQTLSVPIEPGVKIAYWLEARDNLEPFPGREANFGRTPVQHFEIIDPVATPQAEEAFQQQQQHARERLDETRAAETDGAAAPAEQPADEEPAGEGTPLDPERPQTDPPQGTPGERTPQTPLEPGANAPQPMPGDEGAPPQGNDPLPGESGEAPMRDPAEPMQNSPQSSGEKGSQGDRPQPGNTSPSSTGSGGERGSSNSGTPPNPAGDPSATGISPSPGGESGAGSSPAGDRPPTPNQRPADGAGPRQDGSAGERPPPEGAGPNGDRPQSTPNNPANNGDRPSGAGSQERGNRDHASDETILRELAERLRQQDQPKSEQGKPGDAASGEEPNSNSASSGDKPGREPSTGRNDSPQPGDQRDPAGEANSGTNPGDKPGPTKNAPSDDGNAPGERTDPAMKPETGATGEHTGNDSRTPGESTATGREQPRQDSGTGNAPMPAETGTSDGQPGSPPKGDQPSTTGNQQKPGTAPGQPGESPTQGDGAKPESAAPAEGAQGQSRQTGMGEKPAEGVPMANPVNPQPADSGRGAPSPNPPPMGDAPQPPANAEGAGGKPSPNGRPAGNPPPGESPAKGDQPGATPPNGQTPAGTPPQGAQPGQPGQATAPPGQPQPPGNAPPPNGTPMPGQPNGSQPGNGAPSGGQPAGGQPAGGQPAGGQPAGGQPAGGQPAGGQPAGGQPAGGQPAGGQPAGGQPAGGQPAGGQPAGGQPAGGQPAGGQPAGGQPAGGQPGGAQPGGGQPGGGQPGGGQPGSGQPGGGAGGPGSGAGAPGAKGGGGSPSDGRPGSGGEAPTGFVAEDLRNLADERRAADLVLKQLRDQLERGEVDAELKRQLGVSDEDLRKFADRLEERLSSPNLDDTPEARDRRRQFEELLRGMQYGSEGAGQSGATGPQEAARGSSGIRRPTPPEYRDQERAFREKATGQRR